MVGLGGVEWGEGTCLTGCPRGKGVCEQSEMLEVMRKLTILIFLLLTLCVSGQEQQPPEWYLLVREAVKLKGYGFLDDALAKMKEAVISAEASGDIRAYGAAINNQAVLQMEVGEYAGADESLRIAQGIYEQNLGPNHEHTAKVYKNRGLCLTQLARYQEAESFTRKALDVYLEMDVARNQWQTLELMSELAEILYHQDRLEEARDLFKEALEKLEAGPSLASAQSGYAQVLDALGDTDGAEKLIALAQAYWENHPEKPTSLAGVLKSRANLLRQRGQVAQAESLMKRALQVYDKALPGRPGRAKYLNDLGLLYSGLRDYEKAEDLVAESVRIHEKWMGAEHPETATTLGVLAGIYSQMGRLEDSEKMYRRALAINEKVYGKNHTAVATDLNNLGVVLLNAKRAKEAVPLLQRALSIKKASKSEDLATMTGVLGSAYHEMGDLGKAKELFLQALDMGDSETRAIMNNNLSYLSIDEGDPDAALGYAKKASQAQFEQLKKVFSFTSERQRLAFKKDLVPYGLFASLNQPEALMQAALRFKGVVLDSIAEDYRLASQGDEELKARLGRLRDVKRELMKLDVLAKRSPEEQAKFKELQQRLEEDQAYLARRVSRLEEGRAAFRVTPNQIQAALPKDSVLVEFLYHGFYFGKNKSEKRYGALILAADGPVQWVELGSAAEIESLVGDYRMAMRGGSASSRASRPSQPGVAKSRGEEQLKKAYDKLWQPIADLLPQGTKRVILSPDGDLNFVSFTTLLSSNDKFLGELFDISYVSSGRDLLAFGSNSNTEKSSFLLGAPDYRVADSQREEKAYEVTLSPLPGSAQECQTLEALLKAKGFQPRLVTAQKAQEEEVSRLQSPEIVHLATHGFFLDEKFGHNPMLRSGLALYGAETTLDAWQDGKVPESGSDGVLTALEVTGLNLTGTKVVVLSACDTGLGESQKGEGVLGLRRGFVQAGCRNLVFTLWPVADQETAEFMVDFYDSLPEKGAVSSLNTVQRDWLGKLREQYGSVMAARLAGPFVISSRE